MQINKIIMVGLTVGFSLFGFASLAGEGAEHKETACGEKLAKENPEWAKCVESHCPEGECDEATAANALVECQDVKHNAKLEKTWQECMKQHK